MKKTLVFTLVFLVVAGALFAAGAREADQQVYRLRTSTNLAASGTVGRALQYFVDDVNESSGGRINATANFGSELGTQREQVEMAQTGSLEMVVASPPSALAAYVPQLQALNIPYILRDEEHFVRVLNSLEDEISRLLAPHNFVAVGGQNMGFRHMLVRRRPVYEPADLRGLQMRGPNPVYVEMFESLGASGVTTDWTDVYTSLQTGVIDGMEASPDMIYSMRFQEQAEYLSKTFHIAASVFYFFNREWYEALPSDLQDIVMESARKAAAYQNRIDLEAQEESMQKMIDEGVTVNEVNDLSEFARLTAPMVESFRARGPEWADFIDKIQAIQ
ncbi:MAG: TRAP transporter substrate-binding protein [Spirochaetaceae bacterium]|nr:MAG: TRAP transporter substrate-binding protein [Spirochaetaceae bacterium]